MSDFGFKLANISQKDLSPSAVWAGPVRDEHFLALPLPFGKIEGSAPFRLSRYIGYVGHTLIASPAGAGKSVLLAPMAMQFRRYRSNRIFAFDLSGSIRTTALVNGGVWHDFGGSL